MINSLTLVKQHSLKITSLEQFCCFNFDLDIIIRENKCQCLHLFFISFFNILNNITGCKENIEIKLLFTIMTNVNIIF